MKILVTGSAGMIGGYVVKGLIEKGHKVIGVDRIAKDTSLTCKHILHLYLLANAYPL